MLHRKSHEMPCKLRVFDRRLYLGGGGSILGYKYQLAGPLDGDNDPIGGRGSLEFGVETRIRFNENWGMVLFYDGGILSDEKYPKFSDSSFHGAGIGGRYYTDFGPIRLDLAFPLRVRRDANKKRVDDAFQVYISIGQAF